MTDWTELSAGAALASHQLVGWMFWDPVAIEKYAALGVPNGFGFYVASRGAPLLPAGHQAVTAAFATINAEFIRICVEPALAHTTRSHLRRTQRCGWRGTAPIRARDLRRTRITFGAIVGCR